MRKSRLESEQKRKTLLRGVPTIVAKIKQNSELNWLKKFFVGWALRLFECVDDMWTLTWREINFMSSSFRHREKKIISPYFFGWQLVGPSLLNGNERKSFGAAPTR